MTDMKRFNSHKQRVTAQPMTRQAYNDLRGWELPVDECGADDGYLVVDINADSNFEGYDGHVSWKPKALFENQYYEVDADLDLDSNGTVGSVRYADETSVCGYGVNGSTRQGLSLDQELMRETISCISHKYADARTDQMIEDANKIVSAIMGRDSQATDIADSAPIPDVVVTFIADRVELVTPNESELLAERISDALGVQVNVTGEFVPCAVANAQIKNASIGQDRFAAEEGAAITNVAGVNIAGSFDFGLAIHCLKAGKKVARAGWNGKGMYLLIIQGSNDIAKLHGYGFGEALGEPTFSDAIFLKTADNKLVPWTVSQADALATDWQIV